jgi:hypothetical protein
MTSLITQKRPRDQEWAGRFAAPPAFSTPFRSSFHCRTSLVIAAIPASLPPNAPIPLNLQKRALTWHAGYFAQRVNIPSQLAFVSAFVTPQVFISFEINYLPFVVLYERQINNAFQYSLVTQRKRNRQLAETARGSRSALE